MLGQAKSSPGEENSMSKEPQSGKITQLGASAAVQ